MKLLELQKIAGYGRTSPLRAKAVYLGAPEDRAKSLFRTHGALVMRNFGDFRPDLLAPFLAQF